MSLRSVDKLDIVRTS